MVVKIELPGFFNHFYCFFIEDCPSLALLLVEVEGINEDAVPYDLFYLKFWLFLKE